jgi:hypothetical protein
MAAVVCVCIGVFEILKVGYFEVLFVAVVMIAKAILHAVRFFLCVYAALHYTRTCGVQRYSPLHPLSLAFSLSIYLVCMHMHTRSSRIHTHIHALSLFFHRRPVV